MKAVNPAAMSQQWLQLISKRCLRRFLFCQRCRQEPTVGSNLSIQTGGYVGVSSFMSAKVRRCAGILQGQGLKPLPDYFLDENRYPFQGPTIFCK